MCTCIAIHRIVYICIRVCMYIYIAESDSIYFFSPKLKMGVVYFGWKRHGSGVSSPLWFLLPVVWIGPKQLVLTYREGILQVST